jgi:hypothetical protein
MEGNLVQISLSINGQHIDVTEFGDRLSELHDVRTGKNAGRRTISHGKSCCFPMERTAIKPRLCPDSAK